MALSPVVLQKLNTLIQDEVGLLWGVDKEMKGLSLTLSLIQGVLQDAEQKQVQGNAIQAWLRILKDAAYELDDILDECATESLRWESLGQRSSFLEKVSTFLLNCYPIQYFTFRHKIGNRMRDIAKNLDQISKDRSKLDLREVVVENRVLELADQNRETSSVLNPLPPLGRDEDKEKIVEKLLSEEVCGCKDVSFYPVVGMGGLGKTTLAQMVFNDQRVKQHFEPEIWVYVSQKFDVNELMKTIIKSLSGKTCEASDLGSLQEKLRGMLNGKRFLLVLDDVWEGNLANWDKLKCGLACGSRGASVIVTTRIDNVASTVTTLPLYRLSLLSEDHCWSLFRQHAFGPDNEETPKLAGIGKEIVKKCGRLPLAAKALGGAMRSKRSEEEWLFVKESDIWNLPQDENSILPALRLSYYNLPLNLRRCFAYCVVFPKGSKIEKGNLINLWIANGYISSTEKWQMEDIGDNIWNELQRQSFFQDADELGSRQLFQMGSNPFPKRFTMHDLVHDLAQSVMEDEWQMMDFKSLGNRSNNKVRHITLVAEPTDDFQYTFDKLVSLRTFQLDQASRGLERDMSKFLLENRKFGSLRVFDARFNEMTKLPSSIGRLKLLRYLDLSHTKIQQLPDSICYLWNLQTLNLDCCYYLQRLPEKMKYLRNLRHLYLESCPLIDMPPEIGQLTCLKTLSKFVVGKRRGCHLAELSCLDLGGKLRIEHLERVTNELDAKKANLVGKKNLQWFELCWGENWEDNAECESQENVEQLLEDLQPPPNIKGLVIRNYKGTHLPLWMTDSSIKLGNLVELELFNCSNLAQLPEEGLRGLESLRLLRVCRCNKLSSLSEGLRHFTALETLEIDGCPELVALPEEGLRGLESLQRLDVSYCNKLSSLSEGLRHLTALERLKISDCPELVALPEGIKYLNSLRYVTIWFQLKMFDLLEALQHVPALQSLDIGGSPYLASLPDWLGNLTSLQSISIRACPNIASLPASIQSLSKLQSLTLDTCGPELEMRCEKGKGQDWYKIAHVPNVQILHEEGMLRCLFYS